MACIPNDVPEGTYHHSTTPEGLTWVATRTATGWFYIAWLPVGTVCPKTQMPWGTFTIADPDPCHVYGQSGAWLLADGRDLAEVVPNAHDEWCEARAIEATTDLLLSQ